MGTRKAKYKRPQGSKKSLLRTVRSLFKQNMELRSELATWNALKADLVNLMLRAAAKEQGPRSRRGKVGGKQ